MIRAALILLCFAGPAIAELGSIYFDATIGVIGMSVGLEYQGVAQQQAHSACGMKGGSKCSQVFWFRNSCSAIAVGDGHGCGVAWAEDIRTAQDEATYNCIDAGNPGCVMHLSDCAFAE